MKVLIADEHALFRDGLGLLIEQLDGSATILQASNFAQALKILDTEHKFDLIIIDLDMQDMVWEKGFDAIRAKAGDARLCNNRESSFRTQSVALCLENCAGMA